MMYTKISGKISPNRCVPYPQWTVETGIRLKSLLTKAEFAILVRMFTPENMNKQELSAENVKHKVKD